MVTNLCVSFSGFVGCQTKQSNQDRPRVIGHTNQDGKHSRHHSRIYNHQLKPVAAEEEIDEKFKLWDDGPNFDTDLRQNVVALIGRTAYLTCRVFDRGNKTVSLLSTLLGQMVTLT